MSDPLTLAELRWYKPCGACGRLVYTPTGCVHWRQPGKVTVRKPGRVPGRAREAEQPPERPNLPFLSAGQTAV